MKVYICSNTIYTLGSVSDGGVVFDKTSVIEMMKKNSFLSDTYLLIKFKEWKNKGSYPSEDEILYKLFEEQIKGNEIMEEQYLKVKSGL